MKERKRTEAQQKDLIFDIFSKCQSEAASSRRQIHYLVLCEQIYRWYKDYLCVDVDRMGLEIANVINRFLKDNNISNIPKEKDGFFKYLNTAITKEKASYYRSYNEKDIIKIPKEKKAKLRAVEDYIRMREGDLGRKLTSAEKQAGVSKWFKNQEYVDLLNSSNLGSISFHGNDENNEMDPLNVKAVPVYNTDIFNGPLDEYLIKFNTEAIREVIKSALDKKQKRSRECYRALFTLYCIENMKNYEGLYSVLDKNILESCQKDGKRPNQYEIYQKYHPKTQNDSAGAMASKNLKGFLGNIEELLKEKN